VAIFWQVLGSQKKFLKVAKMSTFYSIFDILKFDVLYFDVRMQHQCEKLFLLQSAIQDHEKLDCLMEKYLFM
jgi:hypothetical protein